MKIVSNFKDYYDYMVSKYGIDDKIVYERIQEIQDSRGWWGKTGMHKPEHLEHPKTTFKMYTISFCGRQYYSYYVYGDWYFGDEILQIKRNSYPEMGVKPEGVVINPTSPYKMLNDYQDTWKQNTGYRSRINLQQGALTDLNDKLNCPVVLGNDIRNPRLADYSFGKIFPPDDAFIHISNWLSREKILPDTQTNNDKITGHGFDLKTSFRKM